MIKRIASGLLSTLLLASSSMQMAMAATVDMNLSSKQTTMSAPSTLSRPVSINVGGTRQVIAPGASLTPAEYVALTQVLQTGRQSIHLGADGNAIGGTFRVGSTFNSDVSNLTIPKGVLSISNPQMLNVLGDLNNSGVLYVQALNRAPMSIHADNIINNAGALIKSNAILNLLADHQIVNAGTITTPRNLNLLSPSITNSGLISSTLRNINISSAGPADIVVNNAGGKFSAPLGSVNVRDASFVAKNDFHISGGDLQAKQINIWSGTGNVRANVEKVIGQVNIDAGTASVSASTKNLKLGNIHLVGDPTFYNVSGDITISGNISTSGNVGAPVAIVASGNIITTAPVIINTTGTGGNGGDVTMLAGANFTANPPATGPYDNSSGTTTGAQNSGSGDSSTSLTISGGSATGGKIDLSAGAATITTSAPAIPGNVTMVAFAGSNPASGTVNLGSSTIQGGSTGSGPGSNVFIIAGATADPSANLSAINMTTSGSITTGGSSNNGGGTVVMATATPTINSPFLLWNGSMSFQAQAPGTTLNPGSNVVTVVNLAGAGPVSATQIGPFKVSDQVQVSAPLQAGGEGSDLATITNIQVNSGNPSFYDITVGNISSNFTASSVVYVNPNPFPVVSATAVKPASINMGGNVTTSPQGGIVAVSGAKMVVGGAVTTNGGDVSLYAKGPISGATTAINAGGGRVLMTAGANLASMNLQAQYGLPTQLPMIITTTLDTGTNALTGSSGISLPNAAITGAPVFMFAGSGVTVGGASIASSGTSSGVSMLAGGNIQAPNITTSGGGGSAGAVTLVSGIASLVPTVSQTFDGGTAVDTITTAVPTVTGLNAGSTITVGTIGVSETGAAPIVLLAGSAVTAGAITTTATAPVLIAGSSVSLGGNIASSGSSTLADVSVISGGNINGSSLTSLTAGAGGSLLLVAGAPTITPTFAQTFSTLSQIIDTTANVAVSGALSNSAGISLPNAALSGAPVVLMAGKNIVAGSNTTSITGGGVSIFAGGNIAAAPITVSGANASIALIAGMPSVTPTLSQAYNSFTNTDALSFNPTITGPLTAGSTVNVSGTPNSIDGTSSIAVMAGGAVSFTGEVFNNGGGPIIIAGNGVSLGGNVTTGGTDCGISIFSSGDISGSSVAAISASGAAFLSAGANISASYAQDFDTATTKNDITASLTASSLSGGNITLSNAAITGAPIGLMAGGSITVGGLDNSSRSGGVIGVAGGNLSIGGPITASGAAIAGAVMLVSGAQVVKGTGTGSEIFSQAFTSSSNANVIKTSASIESPLSKSATLSTEGVSVVSGPILIAGGGTVTLNGAVAASASPTAEPTIILSEHADVAVLANVLSPGPQSSIGIYARHNINGPTGATGINISTSDGTNQGTGPVVLSAGAKLTSELGETLDFTTLLGGFSASVNVEPVNQNPGAINLGNAAIEGAPVIAFATSNINLGGNVPGAVISTGGALGGVTIVGAGNVTGPQAGITTSNPLASSADGGVLMIAGASILPSLTQTYDTATTTKNIVSQLIVGGTLSPSATLTMGGASTNSGPVTLLSGGNLVLNGSISTTGSGAGSTFGPGGVLNIAAGGSISGTATSLSTAADLGATIPTDFGSDLTMVAGSVIKATVTHNYTNSPAPGSDVVGLSLSLSGPSKGGNINLPNLAAISTNAAVAGNAGGNVQIVAFAGSANPTATGSISMPLVQITTGGMLSTGSDINPNGNVTILAGQSTGTSITLGGVDTTPSGTGKSMGAGNIAIVTANPLKTALPFTLAFTSNTVNTPGQPYFTSTGSFTAGSLVPASIVLNDNLKAEGGSSLVSINGVTIAPPTAITVRAGQNLTVGSVTNTNNALPQGGITLVPFQRHSSSTILLSAGGNMRFAPGSTISSNAAAAGDGSTDLDCYGVNGGTIAITAKSLTTTGGVTVSADGTNGYFGVSNSFGIDPEGGNGGSISIKTTGNVNSGATSSAIVVGPTNAFQISAQGDLTGGNGGYVSLDSGLNISITVGSSNLNVSPHLNPNPPSGVTSILSSGVGGTLILRAATTLFANGTLDVSGAPSTLTPGAGYPGGSGGILDITVNSATPFTINATNVNGNGIAGGVLSANGNVGTTPAYGDGGSITVRNLNAGTNGTGGIVIGANGIQVIAADATTLGNLGVNNTFYPGGHGGHIVLDGASVLSQGSLNADGGAHSPIAVGGSGGSISITTNSKLTDNTFTVAPSASSALNGVIGSLSASGNVGAGGVVTGSANANTIPSGAGGSITLINKSGGITLGSGAVMSVAAASANPVIGKPGADGGSIVIDANGRFLSAIALDASGGADATVSTTAGAVTGQGPGVPLTINGVVSTAGFFLGQVIYVSEGTFFDTTNIVSSPTSNTIEVGQLVQSYTTPTIQAYFSGGHGGSISITTNSKTPFVVGNSAGTNGVSGSITAAGFNGGNISITNRGAGGINIGADNSQQVYISVASVAPASQPGPLMPLGGIGGNIALLATGAGGNVVVNGPLVVDGSSSVAASGELGPSGGGLGGNIFITTNSSKQFIIGAPVPTTTSPLLNGVVAATTNNIALSAAAGTGTSAGGNAGSITVVNLGTGGIKVNTTAGVLAINLAPGTSSLQGGDGGSLSLQATGTGAQVLITSTLGIDGATSGPGYALGSGGTISITSNSSNAFILGGSAGITNGVVGAVTANGWSGGSVTISNLGGGITVGSGQLTVTAQDGANWGPAPDTDSPFTGGTGGSISLQAPKGKVFINGGLDVSGGAQYSTPVGAEHYVYGGSGGQLSILTNSSTPFNIGGASSGNGSSGALTANGFNGGVISVTNLGKGGIIVPLAASISVNGNQSAYYCQSCEVPTIGSVTFGLTGGNSGSIYLQALGAGGTVYVGGVTNLSADGFIAGAGTASNGVNGATNPGNGGTISIVSNSSSAFDLGNAVSFNPTAPKQINGVIPGVSLSAGGYNAGSIGVKNLGTGGIKFNPAAILVVASGDPTAVVGQTAVGNGGNIDLEAPAGTISLSQITTNGLLSANAAQNAGPSSHGGTITLNALTITPTVLNASSQNVTLSLSAIGDQMSGNESLGGSVVITQTNATRSITVGSAAMNIVVNGTPLAAPPSFTCETCTTTGGKISVDAPGGIVISGILSTYDTTADKNNASGSIVLRSTGTGSITGSTTSRVYAGNLTLRAGNGGIGTSATPFNIRTASLTAIDVGTNNCTTCNIYLQNSGSADLVVNRMSANLGAISLISSSNIVVNGKISSGQTIALTATGDNSEGQIILNGDLVAHTVTLTANSGTIRNADFGLIGMTAFPDAYNWVTLNNVDGLYVGQKVMISGYTTSSSATALIAVPATEVTTITGIDKASSAVQFSTVTVLYNDPNPVGPPPTLPAYPSIVSAPGTGSGLIAADGTKDSKPAVVLSTGAGGVGSSSSPIRTSAGFISTAITGSLGGLTDVWLTNTGNVLLKDSSVFLTNYGVNSTGSITTLGGLTSAANIGLSNNNPLSIGNQSIILGGPIGAGTANSAVTLSANGSIVQLASANLISANTIVLNSFNGNVGTVQRRVTNNIYTPTGTPIFVKSVDGLTPGIVAVAVTGPGTINVSNSGGNFSVPFASAGGDILLTASALSAAGQFAVTGPVVSVNGAVTILNSASSGPTNGVVSVAADVTAGGAPLVIQNNTPTNNATPIISIGAVNLSGKGWILNGQNVNPVAATSSNVPVGVAILAGSFPASPVQGSNPDPNNIVQSGNLNVPIYFGNAGSLLNTGAVSISTGIGPTSTAAAVAFQGGAISSNGISLDGGLKITSNSISTVISTFDLSAGSANSKAVIAALQALQQQPNSGVAGTLSNTGTGTLIFDASSGYSPEMLGNLNTMNIPKGLTVTFANFNEFDRVVVNNKGATISGTVQFLGATVAGATLTPNSFRSEGLLFINSATPGNVLTVNTGGVLSSDNNLTLNVGGSISLAGSIQAGNYSHLHIYTGSSNPMTASSAVSATTLPAGVVTVSGGSLKAGQVGDPATIALVSTGGIVMSSGSVASNGFDITIGGANYLANSSGTPVMITPSKVSSTGAILTVGDMTITAGSSRPGSTTPSINIIGAGKTGFSIGSLELSLDNSPVILTQSGAIGLSGSVLNTLTLTTSGTLSTNGDVDCTSCTFNVPLLSNNNVIAATGAVGQITITGPAGASVLIEQSSDGLLAAAGGVTITSKIDLGVRGGTISTASGTLSLSSKGGILIDGASLTAGSFNGVPQNVLLAPSDIAAKGSVVLAATNFVNMFNVGNLQSIGGDVILTGKSMALIGNITANGGNVLISSSGNVSGETVNITANAVGTTATNSVGGGISIASGTSTPAGNPSRAALQNAFNQAPGTLPNVPLFLQPAGTAAPLGYNIDINNDANDSSPYSTGAIVQSTASGARLNLNNAGGYPSTLLNVSGGAMSFTAGGTSQMIFNTSTFSTNAFTPISLTQRATTAATSSFEECLVDADDDAF